MNGQAGTGMDGQTGIGALVTMMDGTKGGAGLPDTVGLMMDGTKGDHDRSRGYNDSDGVILLHD